MFLHWCWTVHLLWYLSSSQSHQTLCSTSLLPDKRKKVYCYFYWYHEAVIDQAYLVKVVPNYKSCSFLCFNPLTLKSDCLLISPNSINPESTIKVMRIKERITSYRRSWFFNKFSLSTPWEMYGEHSPEYTYWFSGVKD